MATPKISENSEVEEHYLAQFALVSGVTNASRELWPSLDPENLSRTGEPVVRALSALTQQYASAAAGLAADHYAELRADHIPGRFRVPMIEIPEKAISVTIRSTYQDALGKIRQAPDEIYIGEITNQLIRQFEIAAGGAVANAGSDEIFAALTDDDRALGWARITRPGACYFCRMLASRGAVYYTKNSGNFRAHVPMNGRGGVCRCTVEPQFSRNYEPTAQAREDRATWDRVTKGLSGPDAIDAFRRSVEGREDGPQRPRRRVRNRRKESENAVDAPKPYFDQMTPGQLRHQLSVIESLPDSAYKTKEVKRINDRLADLAK